MAEYIFEIFVFTDVPVWLKSLRLHKYAYLFQQLTYEEMMTLTEDWLEQQVRFPQIHPCER